MLFTAFVLITIDREHDCLKERINLGHRNESAEMRDVLRFGLQQEQEIAVFLCLLVVGKHPLL